MRALVVGLGSIGQRHARNLRRLLGGDLVLCALRSGLGGPVVTDGLRAGAGDPAIDCDGGVFTDLRAALRTRPEIVIVCTPTSLHLPVARAAVEAGASVLVEKPVSDGLFGLAALDELASERGVAVSVGFQLRYHPALLALRAHLGSGSLGRLVAVDAVQGEYLPGFHPYEDYRRSYAARAELGGGVLLTQIHELDYLGWLFGPPDAVFAVGGHTSDLEVNVEDNVTALMSCTSAGRPLPVAVHLDFLRRPPARTCTVIGEQATAVVDLREPSLTLTGATGDVLDRRTFPGFDRNDLFLAELEHFLAASRGEEPPAVPLAEAAGSLGVALAIRACLAHGGVERLGPAASTTYQAVQPPSTTSVAPVM